MKIIDTKLPITGTVIGKTRAGNFWVKWHNGETSWITKKKLKAKRYIIL